MRMTEIGWYIENGGTPRSIFFPPKRISGMDKATNSDSSLHFCPAIQDARRDHYAIKSPWDLKLEVMLLTKGAELLMSPSSSSLSPTMARSHISLVRRSEWRDRNRPIIQIFVPYVFCPSEDLVIGQYPPFMHFFGEKRPGLVMCGEFRAQAWPRPLAFAFEWYDIARPLVISRGEPLFYVSFVRPIGSQTRLIEIEKSLEIQAQQERIGGVAAHVRHTGQLIDEETARYDTIRQSE